MIPPLRFGSLNIKAPDKNSPITVTATFDGSNATSLEWWNGSYRTSFSEVGGIAPGAPSTQSLREAPGKLKTFLTQTLPGKLIGDANSGYVGMHPARFLAEKLQSVDPQNPVQVTWVPEQHKDAHNAGVKPHDFPLHGELPTGLVYPAY